jgi:deoxycytidine triphosphate deaminase
MQYNPYIPERDQHQPVEKELPQTPKMGILPGLLSDGQIAERCRKGLLISEEFAEKQLMGCCYEFRVGRIAYSYDYEKKITKQQQSKIHIIYPFETLTIVTMEKINLDNQHFLLLFSKGSLFSLGLTPVSTAADPGFRGPLGITMTNLSARPIQFSAGTGFIKGSFFQLAKEAVNTYVGQHGDATMSWPYPSQFHTEPLDFESWEAQHWRFLPPPLRISFIRLRYVERYIKWIIMSFSVLIFTNLALGSLKSIFSPDWYSFIDRLLNLLGSLASIAGFLLSIGLLRKK